MLIDHYFSKIQAVVSSFIPNLEDSVCIDIQNVYESLHSDNSPPLNVNLKTDLPTLAPPWPLAWFEYHSIERETKAKWGFLMQATECDPQSITAKPSFLSFDETKKFKWIVSFFFFVELRGHRFLPVFVLRDALDAEGSSILGEEVAINWFGECEGGPPEALSGIIPLIFPVWESIAFLHCKNVMLHEAEISKKLQKAREKRGVRPLFKFKILDILPMKKILQKEGSLDQNGLKKALHLCRGHFKDYSEGRGLFGKFKGLFWWDMHTKGDLSTGILSKEYRVKISSPEKK